MRRQSSTISSRPSPERSSGTPLDEGRAIIASMKPPAPLLLLLCLTACKGGDTGAIPDEDTSDSTHAIVLGEVQACEAPLPGPSWTERGAELGLEGALESEGDHSAGGSVVVHDLDGDGWEDILLGYDDVLRIYRGGEGGFEELLAEPQVEAVFLGLTDLEGDGEMEALVASRAPESIHLRDGIVRTPLTLESPWNQEFEAPPLIGLIPADVNGDGFVDLTGLLHNFETEPDRMWLGQGGHTFEPDAAAIDPTLGTRMAFDATWFDWDVDGDLDLYVVNDKGHETGPNQLYINDGGTLRDGSEACFCDLAISGMGVSPGDYDRDGIPDLFLAATSRNVLLNGSESGAFADTTLTTGANTQVDPWQMGWGAAFLDYDSDGWLDILVALGDQYIEEDPVPVRGEQPISLLAQRDGSFVEVAPELGLDHLGSWRSVVGFHYNDDGVLDLLVTDVRLRPQLFVSDGCTDANWLAVEAPPGSRIEVEAGGSVQTHWSTTHTGFWASASPVTHVGLGEASTVDLLTVILPDGTVVEKSDLEARRTVSVEMN
ncbi:MAG: hypothetical protein ACI8RZ_005033 [Myxococcota bacterium]|jgi:hypothetical protein